MITVAEFAQKHIELVEKERKQAVKEMNFLNSGVSLHTLQKFGFAMSDMVVTSTVPGPIGKTVIIISSITAMRTARYTSIRSGDAVCICPPNRIIYGPEDSAQDHQLTGVVTRIDKGRAKLVIDETLPAEWHGSCNIYKTTTDIVYRRIINALRTLVLHSKKRTNSKSTRLQNILFDNLEPEFSKSRLSGAQIFDKSLNSTQIDAVKHAVAARDIALIHGPPGTGKTHTIIEIIRQLVHNGKRVLVCGPSNVSVDNIVERLGKHKLPIVRVGHPARILPSSILYHIDVFMNKTGSMSSINKFEKRIAALKTEARYATSKNARKRIQATMKRMQKSLNYIESRALDMVAGDVSVVLSTLNGSANRMVAGLSKGERAFDVVIVDEATQATEGDCWIAALQAPKLILAGDHHQLPPIAKFLGGKIPGPGNGKRRKHGQPPPEPKPKINKTVIRNRSLIEITMFERVLEKFGDKVVRMLTMQYRMHRDIMEVSSRALYNNELVPHPSVEKHVLADLHYVNPMRRTKYPLVLINTEGVNGFGESNNVNNRGGRKFGQGYGSKLNRGEADIVYEYTQKLLSCGVKESDIAIISPYNAQVQLVKSLVDGKYPEIEVGSVDGFQGREKEAIILTLVRSNETQEIGFLYDYRRLNVAITRARRHLCIIADLNTVSDGTPFLKALFDHMDTKAVKLDAKN